MERIQSLEQRKELIEQRAEKVNNLLAQAAGLGVVTTRRQARKALSGRGSLKRLIAEAELAKQQAEAAAVSSAS